MTGALRTPDDYELFIYSIREQYPLVQSSTLTFIRRGATIARVAGELSFEHGIRLTVRERIVFDRLPALIEAYGYEVWYGDRKLYWYDSQPHPGDPALASTHPHHKHVPPDLRATRVPAPQLSFMRPNLAVLITEIGELLR